MILPVKKGFVHILFFLLLVQLASAATLTINNPSFLVEDDTVLVSLTVNSAQPFDGTIDFTYSNVVSPINQLSFSASEFNGQEYTNSIALTGIQPGQYTLLSILKNTSGNTLATVNSIGQVNSSAPKVVDSSPTGVLGDSLVEIQVDTDEQATCKYGTTDTSFDNLADTFSQTNGVIHKTTLNEVAEGFHTYYVRCEDTTNHEMDSSHLIQFTVELPPTAKIELSDESPVKEGTIELKLTLSEGVSETPSLQYRLDGGSLKTIPLEGSGENWNGYVIITGDDNNKVGEFEFSAKDANGNIGTKITSGNLFVVDTVKPPAVKDLKATVQDDAEVQLDWYYDGEEIDHFNIYRSTSSKLGFVDFYAEWNTEERYIDPDTLNEVTYYYRVTPVDKAGNEGELSEEVYATSVPRRANPESAPVNEQVPSTTPKPEEVPKVLPPDLIPRVDTYLKKVEKFRLDLEAIESKFNSITQENALLVLEELGLKKRVASSLEEIGALIVELNNKKLRYATSQGLDAQLQQVDRDLQKIEVTTPKDMEIIEESEFIQSTSKEDIEKGVNELLKNSVLTDEEKKNYQKMNVKKKDQITVETKVKIIKLKYLDDSEKQKSYITKILTYAEPEPLEDLVVIEFIPKNIAVSVSEIDFLTSKFEVLEEDPIVKFGFLKFNYEGEKISYTVDKGIDVNTVVNTKTVPLFSLEQLLQENKGNKVTGFALFNFDNLGLSGMQSLFVWLGLFFILFLGGYYFVSLRGEGDFLKETKRQLGRKVNLWKVQKPFRSPIGRSHSQNYYSNDYTLTHPGKIADVQMSEGEAKMLMHEMYHHISTAKSDMVEKLLPMFLNLHQKLEQQGIHTKKMNDDIVDVTQLINKAHNLLDKENHEEATVLYKQIMRLYKYLPKTWQKEVFSECQELHRKLSRFK